MLLRLAEVLDLSDLADLTGDQSLPVASVTRAGHPDIDNVAAAMQRSTVPVDDPTPVDALRSLVDQAWALWHRSTVERTAVAAVLPGLLADAQRSARRLDGLARRQALVELARVYHLAQLYMAHQPYPELVWLAADRAMRAACGSRAAAARSTCPASSAGVRAGRSRSCRDFTRLDGSQVATASGRRAAGPVRPAAGPRPACPVAGIRHRPRAAESVTVQSTRRASRALLSSCSMY